MIKCTKNQVEISESISEVLSWLDQWQSGDNQVRKESEPVGEGAGLSQVKEEEGILDLDEERKGNLPF
jgi:hypothetical protein